MHEIGHAFQRTSGLIDKLYYMQEKKEVLYLSMIGLILLSPIFLTSGLAQLIVFILIGYNQCIMRGIGKIQELSSDNYAVKYGYGDELVKSLYRYYKEDNKENKRVTFFKKILFYLNKIKDEIFYPEDHPSDKRRIQNIKKRIEKEYIKLYPNLSKEISKIFDEMW